MRQVFEMPPVTGSAIWILVITATLTLAIALAMLYITWSMRHVTCTISPAGVEVRGPFYGRVIPFSQIDRRGVAVTDLSQVTEYQPTVRTNGIGLPGFHAGWFKLRNGEKALLFVSDRSEVVRLPTTDGYVAMISLENADAFVAALIASLPSA